MDGLSTLKDEHSSIAVEMYHMDRLLAFLESSGPIRGTRILRELVESSGQMRENLQLHVNKEERGLFPVLEARLGKDRELVEVMRREHAELLASLESLRSELDRMMRDHDTKKTWTLASRLQDLRGDLSDHLSREERVVFWLAELLLSPLDQRRIAFNLQTMTEIPREVRG
jgi:regulator of cell morphogenesis and NO signaling